MPCISSKILIIRGSLYLYYDIENSSWSENGVVDLNGKSKFKHLPVLNSSGLITFFSKDEKWLQAYIFKSGKWRKQDLFVNIPAKDCRVSDIESNAKLPLIIFKHLDGRQYLIKSVKKYSKPSWLNKIWNNTTKKIDGLFSREEDKKWFRYFFGYNGEVYRSRKVKVEKLDKGKQIWNRTYSDFCIISSCYIDEMLKGPDFLALSERVWTIGAGAPSYRYYIFNSTSQNGISGEIIQSFAMNFLSGKRILLISINY
ncbi:MAG: hypothetical protein GY714_19420 [Desulfobacterales bacterium]|nr:hypothetical protein [Desulfobacterales bacterium]